jgi:tetratricopeptide (TPR) repeat protein
MGIFAVISILFNTLLVGNGYSAESNQMQADFYISNIRSDTAPTFHLWGLIKLAESNADSEKYIIEQTTGHSHNPFLSSKSQCLLEVFELFQDGSVAQNKMDRLFHAYQCTDDSDFLVVSLYEIDLSIRQNWYVEQSNLFSPESFTPAQKALIQKALGNPFNQTDLFSGRRFRLSDLYIFENYTYDNALDLSTFFDNWQTQLSNIKRNSPLLSDLLAITLINGHFRLNNFDKIMEMFLSHSGFESFPNSRMKISMLRRVSYAAYYSGYYQTNLNLYRDHLIPLTRLIGDHQDYLIVQFDYGNSLFTLSNFASALKEWEQVYNDSVGIVDNRYQSGLLNNLAVSYLKTGNFDQYIQLQINALRKAEEVNDYDRQLFYLNNLYIYHRRNSNWDTAFSYLNQALELSSVIQDPKEVATILRSLGTYYREVENDFDKALHNLFLADSYADSTGMYWLKNTINTEIGPHISKYVKRFGCIRTVY